LAHFALGVPLQLSDSFGNLAGILDIPYWDAVRTMFTPSPGYYRPLLLVQLKTVLDLSGGSYFAWYKGVQVLQIVLCIGFFVRLLRVRTGIDAAAATLAVAVLVGLHTFNGTIRETFPINTHMTILVACLATANLVVSRGGWWTGAAAVGLFLFAALTVESGLLIWVIVAAAFIAGLRGIPRWGVLAVTLAFAGYLVARLLVFDVGGPGLDERSTGFGLRVMEPSELTARFDDRRPVLYAYNIAGNMSSVLFSEPRAGVFVLVGSLFEGDLRAWRLVNVVSSGLMTLAVLAYGCRRYRTWRRGEAFDACDRLAFVAAGVIGANAVLGYAYSKDVIMSPAGVFYALLAYVAMRHLLEWWSASPRSVAATLAVSGLLILVSAGWAVRLVGLHVSLRDQAARVREDWATADQELGAAAIGALTPGGLALKHQLQQDALTIRPWPPGLWLPLDRRLFDRDY
jgi:hypothetical protein